MVVKNCHASLKEVSSKFGIAYGRAQHAVVNFWV